MNWLTRLKPRKVVETSAGVVPLKKDKPSVGDRIRVAQNMAIQCWELVKQRSREYAVALDMNDEQIKQLEHFKAIVVVHTEKGEVFLVPKNTCGCYYGDTWRCLLQARLPNGNPNGIGGGTAFIYAFDAEMNKGVMEAIRLGQTEIRQGSIWP